jgi:hypothetical protein
MRNRFRPSHGTVVAYVALFVALGGTAVAANGGNFILGQSNSAGNPTQLSSPTTNAAGALKVTNTNTTTAGRGISAVGGAGGYGLYASGGNQSKGTAAIHGQSGAGNAVEGFSTANPASGVFGQDNGANSYGVAGHSDNGIAVVGDSSNGWAMQALGNTTQTRNASGFVKAMALIEPGGSGVVQCFNSQLPPAQATTAPCGITVTQPGPAGVIRVNFGFEVDDRFALATGVAGNVVANVAPLSSPNTAFTVRTFIGGSAAANSFYIIVY